MADSAKTTDDPTVAIGNEDANLTPVESPETSDALDALLKQAQGDDGEGDPAPTAKADETPAAPKADEGTPAPADLKPKSDADIKPKADAAPADGQPAAPAATDDLDTVELPPHTKPRTAESFAKLKFMARERLTAIQKERDELKSKYEQAEQKAKDGMTPEVKKELEELRAFRQKVDVEADPAFTEWDAKVKSNDELIYGRLKSSGFSEDTLKKIQELGGPANVDWDAVGDKLPAGLKRYIEGKVFENEDLAEKKKAAIAKAKENAAEYLKTRQTQLSKGAEQIIQETTEEFTKVRANLKWFAKQDVSKAKPEEKALVEAHNKLVDDIEADVKDALADNSPGMKSLLVSAYCQARRSKFEYDVLKSSTDAKIEQLQKELTEKSSLLERIKKSGTPRLSSSAPTTPSKQTSAQKTAAEINEHGSDALDRHLKEALAEQE